VDAKENGIEFINRKLVLSKQWTAGHWWLMPAVKYFLRLYLGKNPATDKGLVE
jgi:hypothetical protein